MSKKDKKNKDRSRSRDRKDKKRKNDKESKKKSKKHHKSRSATPEQKLSKQQQQQKSPSSSPQKQLADPKKIQESDLIDSLREQTGFLQEKYNEKLQKDKDMQQLEQKNEIRKEKPLQLTTRAGGVYIPPHKLRAMQQEILEKEDQHSKDHQKLMWELLRKSINGIINKVNITNIQNVIIELLNENVLRGKGLLARAIIKAQMASPNFTHVYAGLIAVVNTKLPEIVNLIIKRVILQFQKAYKRNNKIVCQATIKMLAHLINQQVLSDYVGLQILMLFLEEPTEDTVELACDFMTECGAVLSDLSPPGVNAIFQRFKGILHEGDVDKRVQYNIENLFAVIKSQYKDHPGVIPELDLVELEDQITHNFDILEPIDSEEMLNIFKFDPFYEKTEAEWEEIKKEILGEENILMLKETIKPEEDEEIEEEEEKIRDLTEDEKMSLRRTIYLTIMSSVDFEECAHKILKMNIGLGQEEEVCFMIVDCCMNERTYLRFYGLLAQRFCELSDNFRDNFMKCFVDTYTTIHRHETNKIRNSAKLFSHLLYTDAIDWRILNCIILTQESTTASSRIFIKNLIQEVSENMGLNNLNKKFEDEDNKEYYEGLFPTDHPKNTRFAINFFTSIGVGALTEGLRKVLEEQTKQYLQQAPQQIAQQVAQQLDSSDSESSSSSSDSSDSSDSDSDSDSDSSSSSSEEERRRKKKSSKKRR